MKICSCREYAIYGITVTILHAQFIHELSHRKSAIYRAGCCDCSALEELFGGNDFEFWPGTEAIIDWDFVIFLYSSRQTLRQYLD
jgi:hypothetical protein